MGREAALMIQATSAGRLSRSRRLFRMGRKEVRMVATSARRAAMISPSHCKKGMSRLAQMRFAAFQAMNSACWTSDP